MFNVVHRRKGRAWSARTAAVSVGAHLLVVGGIALAAANTEAAPRDEDDRDSIPWLVDLQKKQPSSRPQVKPPTPPPPQATPERGTTPTLQPPDSVPTSVPPPDPGDTPQPPDSGDGPAGPGAGTASPQPQPPAGGDGPLPDFRDSIFVPEDVEQLPRLLNPREAQRLLERVYPGRLRDAGVTGHTTVLLVIDRNGAVQPGSVTVQETTDDAFREAAVHAAERFRFRPATVRGQPVPVWISLPIEWTIQR